MHTSDFPVSTPLMIVWAICLAFAAFFFVRLLNYLLRKNRRELLLLSFALLLLAGAAIHVMVLSQSTHTVTDGNWVQLVLVSLVAGLEMFIGHTVIFDDIIAAVVFHEPGLLLAYLTIFVLILTFSFVMVFQILPRRLRDRLWLRNHVRSAMADRKNHLFIGVTPSAKLLAKSILKEQGKCRRKDQGYLVFIDIPEAEGMRAELSLGDIFTSIVSRRKEASLDEELDSDRFVLLKGRYPDVHHGGDLSDVLGLKNLRVWFRNGRNSVYILGKEEENLALLERLRADSGVRAKVFCLVNGVNGPQSLYTSSLSRVRMIDTHLLSVQWVKFQQPGLHPVHYVDVAKDRDGTSLGYVSSGFHVLHVGFQETGQEYLRFLYEFGAFVGKDQKQVPTSFDIFDDDLDRYRGDFLNRFPGLKGDPSLHWNEGSIGSDLFWECYDRLLGTLNYIVVATGNPDRNVELSIRLLRTAARADKDLSRFVILARVATLDDRTRGILDFFNATYHPGGAPVICPFGVDQDIWDLASISGNMLKESASRFYSAYQHAVGGKDTWESRHLRLSSNSGDQLRNRLSLMREQGQDLSRSAYLPTLHRLAGEGLEEAAARIPSVYEGRHYPEEGADATRLEYLAVQEHLRQCASLRASGYEPGNPDDLLMRRNDLCPYGDLTPADQHFDWVFVKTALSREMEE